MTSAIARRHSVVASFALGLVLARAAGEHQGRHGEDAGKMRGFHVTSP